MNKINITIDYNPKYKTYSLKRIEESDIILCDESNLENITKKILTPKIIFTESAKNNLSPDLKSKLKDLEKIYV